MRLHVKVGTHPAYFADVILKKKQPKVGDCLELKKDGSKPICVRCTLIKNLGENDVLYFMELR
ncbi:MAG: hypothetical protein WC325_13830 [Candidatus Bathyarchaeia archaeon]|jgi:hypothetical protein